jgi:hypothetical protein
MGIRGELFSTKVLLENRTYFFNVKENRLGDLYLNIVESKNRDSGGFDRQSVVLFAEDLTEFLKGFDESLRVLEKAEREKRRSKIKAGDERKSRTREDTEEPRSGGRPSGNPGAGAAFGPARPKVKLKGRTKDPSNAGKGKSGASSRNREKPAKRVVVKRSGRPE